MAGVNPAGPGRFLLVGVENNGDITGVASGASNAPVDCSDFPYLKLYVVASAALSAGTLVLEERDQPTDAAGTITTLTLSTIFSGAGGTYALPIAPQAYGFISASIGDALVGGTAYAILRRC